MAAHSLGSCVTYTSILLTDTPLSLRARRLVLACMCYRPAVRHSEAAMVSRLPRADRPLHPRQHRRHRHLGLRTATVPHRIGLMHERTSSGTGSVHCDSPVHTT